MNPGTVLYCHYPFLAIANIHSIPPQDVNFLELQGCLRVPIRPLLDLFVQQYFLHVHPILPLINEGEFWRLYFPDTDTPPSKPVSLMVFQAILFASCNFLSQSTVHALGYSSTRAMRASYYRRTKLLYDLGSESSPVCIAQAALLLTFTSLSASRTPNTSWLSIAIENAKIAEAHLYASIPASMPQHQEQNILKRVWWCCIIRDRSTGLLMRRPIQITKDQFGGDFHPLGIVDLADEFECSRVYNAATKRILAEVLAQWIELNIILTDILMLVFPLNDSRCLNTGKRHDDSNLLSKCKETLRQWHTSVLSRYPVPEGETISTVCPENDTDICYSSVILYTDLMLMYYHTSRVVLSHYEMLQLDSLRANTLTSTVLTKDLSIIVNSRRDLQDAATCIADYHKELVSLGLDRWLPVSAIGCTALPLLLHILDLKLAPPVEYVTTSSHVLSDPKKHQLNALIEIMKTYQSQYDGVDWITDIVRHIINFAQLDEQGFRSQTSGVDWTDILACQPGTYLRLTLALDLSLRKGRLAQDWDFPVSLRGLFATNASPLKDLVKANDIGHNNSQGHNGTISHGAPVSIELLQSDRDSENEELPAVPDDEYIIEVLEGQIYSHLSGGLGG